MHSGQKKALERIQQAQYLVKEAKFEQALEEMIQYEKLPFEGEEILLYCRLIQSELLLMMGRLKEALELSALILHESGQKYNSINNLDILLSLAQINAQMSNYDEGFDMIAKSEQLLKTLPTQDHYSPIRERELIITNLKGYLYWKIGKVTKTLEYLQHSLTLSEQLGNDVDKAYALNYIGNTYWQKGELNRTLDYFLQSLALREKVGNKQEIAASLNNIAVVYSHRGELDLALDYLHKSLILREKIGNKQDIAISLNNFGLIYRIKGKLDIALDHLQQSLAYFKEVSNKQHIATTLINIGSIYADKSELNQALDYYHQSLVLYEVIGNKLHIAMSLMVIAKVLAEQGKLTSESEVVTQFPPPPYETPIIEAYQQIINALIAQQEGNMGIALKAWQAAVAIKDLDFEYQLICHEALTEITFLEWRRTSSSTTYSLLHKNLNDWENVCKKNNLIPSLCKVLLIRAKLAMASFQLPEAELLLNQALMNAEKSGLSIHADLAQKEISYLRSQSENIENLEGYAKQHFEQIQIDELNSFLKDLSIQATIQRKNAVEELIKTKTKLEYLLQVNIKLKELDQLKSIFLASMSNELRTPLNSIIGFTGWLLMGMEGDLNEKQTKQLIAVKSSAAHLLDLINDILDISKIEAGKVDFIIEEFDIVEVVNEVVTSVLPLIKDKNLKLTQNVPEGILISSDKRRIKQVLMNLTSNAIKFTDQGNIKIEGKLLNNDTTLQVSVSDSGIGIKEEDMDKLFQSFQQIDMSSTKSYEGTGLGLYLCKKILDLLHGNVSVTSQFGAGSEFKFTLPLNNKKMIKNEMNTSR